MSMDIYYKLKEERLHVISILQNLNLKLKRLKLEMEFEIDQDKKEKMKKFINFQYFRRCAAEKRISEINLECSKIGKQYNKACFDAKQKIKKT